MKSFPIALLVGTYHNRLLVPFDDYRAFLNYMVGDYVFLHDVAPARKVVADYLTAVHPKFVDSPAPPEKTDSGSGSRYVKLAKKHFGADELEVGPLPSGMFTVRTVAEAHR